MSVVTGKGARSGSSVASGREVRGRRKGRVTTPTERATKVAFADVTVIFEGEWRARKDSNL